jgi:hypothetical protein
VGVGGWAPCRHRDHFLPSRSSEFCAGQNHMQICEDLSNSKAIVFTGKKRRQGPGVNAKGQKEATQVGAQMGSINE